MFGVRRCRAARARKPPRPFEDAPAAAALSAVGGRATRRRARSQIFAREEQCMKALVWHGKEDIRYDTVSDPAIEDPRDAIIKVTSCAICGSDLHLFHNLVPAMLPGDIMGHETMGEVVEVGSEAKGKLKNGDRVVIPFTIQCGECDQCRRGNFSVCQRTNRKGELGDKAFGHRTAGLFGYTHRS